MPALLPQLITYLTRLHCATFLAALMAGAHGQLASLVSTRSAEGAALLAEMQDKLVQVNVAFGRIQDQPEGCGSAWPC